jgi:hypothetical protein
MATVRVGAPNYLALQREEGFWPGQACHPTVGTVHDTFFERLKGYKRVTQ